MHCEAIGLQCLCYMISITPGTDSLEKSSFLPVTRQLHPKKDLHVPKDSENAGRGFGACCGSGIRDAGSGR